MEVIETLTEGLKREFKFNLNPSELTSRIGNRLTEISKSVKMDGFRPGKVPFEVVKKKYYDSVKSEEMEKFLREKVGSYLTENNMRPIGEPGIDGLNFVEDQKLEFILKLVMMPDISEPDYSSIKLERITCDASEKDIDESLKSIAENSKNYTTKEGESVLTDQVVIDFVGSIDGEEFDGGKAENFDLVLGSHTFIDNFEDQLLGLKAGDETVVKVKFPENYRQKNLAGKPAEFKVKIHEVKKETESHVDEDLAKRIGFKSLDDLKAKVKEELEANYNDISLANLKKSLFDKLEVLYNIEVPENLVKQEFDHLWANAHHHDDHQHDENCDHDHEEMDEKSKTYYQNISIRRVKLGLVLAEVGRIRKVQISNEDLKEAVFSEVRKYPPQQQHNVLEYYRNNPNALEMLRAPILEDKVVELMLNSIEVVEKQVSSKEILEAAKDLQ
jgi:trigger factor